MIARANRRSVITIIGECDILNLFLRNIVIIIAFIIHTPNTVPWNII